MKEECTRNFNRYPCESECEVRIDSEVYSGKAVSFSDGVGVILDHAPQLEKGTRAVIKIFDYEIEFKAEVAWTKKEEKYIMAGFKRLGNFKGNLKHYRLPDIFIGISRGKKTGVLEITSGPTVKKIFIKKGDKLFAASNNKDDRLGEYLLKQGKISLEEFNQASYLVIKTGQRLGKVLVDLGYLKANELYREVQNQIEEIIVSLFLLEEGEFEFKEGPLSKDESITLQISSAKLIYRGIKKINNFVHVKKMCPSVDTVFYLSPNTMNIFKTLTLEEHDKKILALVNGVNSLKTILALSPATNFATLKTICTLLSIGLVHIKGEGDEPQKLPITRIFGDPDEEIMVKFRETIPEVKAGMNKRGDVKDVRGYSEPGKASEEKVIIIGDEESVKEDITFEKKREDNNVRNDTDKTKELSSAVLHKDKESCENCPDCSCSKDSSEEAISEEKSDVVEITCEKTESSGQPEEETGVEISCSPGDGTVIEEEEEAAGEKAENEEQPEEETGVEISCSPGDGTVIEEEEEAAGEKAENEEQPEEETGAIISYSPIDGTVIEETEDSEAPSTNEITESEGPPDKAATEADKNMAEPVYGDDNVAEKIYEETCGHVEKGKMKDLHPVSCPDAEAVMENPDDLRDTFRKPESVETSEETAAASGTGGFVHFSGKSVDEAERHFTEDIDPNYDKAAEEITGEDEIEMVREITENVTASQNNKSRKKCFYVYALLLLAILSASGGTLLYYDINVFDSVKMVFSESAGLPETEVTVLVEKPDAPVMQKTVNLPSLRNEIPAKTPFRKSERTTPFPTFREEALRKLLSE